MKNTIFVFIILIFLSGCRSVNETIEPQNIPAGSFQIILKSTGEVVIDDTDLDLYEINSNEHILHLNAAGVEKIRSYLKWYTQYTPPRPNPEALLRKDFTVNFNGVELYSGQFFSQIFSSTYSGYIILDVYSFATQTSMTINAGYPSSTFFTGSDARNNPDLFKYLTTLGKFKRTN